MTLYNKVKLNFTRLFNILKGIRKKDSFAQNFSFTFSGNLISILLSLIFAPILSRIYPPESYGTFSVYNAIITNVSTFSLLTYNVALILPKEERKFNNLLRLTFLLTIIFSAISFLITLVFTSTILSTFSMKRIGALIYLLAPAIFLLGIGTILSQWLTRDKQFRKLTIVSSSNNLVTKIITLGLGYLSQGNVLGFITGDFLNKVISVLFLFNKKIWKSLKILISKFNLLEIISTAKEFKKYPLLVLPGEYINMFSEQLPIYLISIYFGSKELGYFAFATSILGMPMGLLGNAVRPVFFSKSIYHL